MRKLFSKFALVAIFGFALTFTFSCSGGDDNGGGSSSPSGGGGGGGIVNADNEAWLDASKTQGLLFKQNGEVHSLLKYDGNWYLLHQALYSISGNHMTTSYGNQTRNYTYSISGNTLTLDHLDSGKNDFLGGMNVGVLARTSGVYVSGNWPPPGMVP